MENLESTHRTYAPTPQRLPNATLVLVLGIISIITCICYGQGLILGIVNLFLARNTSRMYHAEPDRYTGHGDVKVGRILSIIGIILSILFLAAIIVSFFMMDPAYLERLMQENPAFQTQGF